MPAGEPPSRACSSLSATSEERPPGSPQELPGTETESQGDEETSSNGAEPGTSLPPSEFSTESEWERVGDWDRNEADAWGRGGREELSSSTSRSSSEQGDARDPRWEQGDAWSRDPRWEQMTIIRRILEKRLGLQHGLRYWERSREHGQAVWAHEARAGVAGVMQQ
ncbi:hypothetical protein Y1Q_0017290 [Alligator mississippiensis]|uniref:Uncharacterized protein n=1 Tax=Alligator mississippiensis TaxID=8496 RepID=A0A151NUI8_ALLMI|nr:hypothetical protein Y1Q_0017290 [Alligator mississippiensis]